MAIWGVGPTRHKAGQCSVSPVPIMRCWHPPASWRLSSRSCAGRRLSQPGEQPHTAGRPCRPVASRGQIVDTNEFITGLIIIILIYLIATILAFWRGTRTAG